MDFNRCYGCMKLKTESPVCEHCGYDETASNASHQIPVGTVMQGKYLVGKVLGQGGFGITYLGWDLYLDIPVAIKEYYPSGMVMRESTISLSVSDCGGDDGVRFRNNKERFLREAKMLARFSQVPEIVQIRNFFLTNNTAYIAMEYVEGITLKQHVKRSGGKLGTEETLTILRPVIEALGKVHQTGLIHRDISPDNIMMLPDGGAKVLDFGAGRDVGAAMVGQSLTSSTESILKPGYAPIEQYQKRGNLGPWTDVYALCGTIYYCLTGEVPPDAPERMLEYDDTGLFAGLENLSPSQKAALEHGTALRTEQRTPSMDELYRELYEVQPQPVPEPEPQPVPVPEPAPEPKQAPKKEAPKAKKKQKKKKRLLPLLLILLLLGGIGFFGYSMTRGDTQIPQVVIGVKSGTCGDDLRWSLNTQSGVLTLEGSGTMTDYASPEETEDKQQLPPWYSHRDKITSVTVTGEVASIGTNAFADCSSLSTVTLNNTVTEIGSGAFRGTAITALKIPYQVRMIGSGAFANCAQLRELTVYRETAISYDTWAEPLVTDENGNIPAGFKLRGFAKTLAEDYAGIFGYNFEPMAEAYWDAEGKCGNDLWWYLDFETGLLKIDGKGAMFDYNGTWQEKDWSKGYLSGRRLPPWSDYRDKVCIVSIGNSVTALGENAFESCENLRQIHFGSGLQSIGAYAFHSNSVETLVLPDSITELEARAFTWCENLRYVQLPLGLKTLRQNVFHRCTNLKELFVGADTVFQDQGDTPFGNPMGSGVLPRDLVIYSLPGSDAERFCKDYNFPEFAEGYMGMYIEEMGQCGNELYWFISGDMLVLYGDGDSWLYQITEEERRDWAEAEWPEEYLHEGNPDFYQYRDRIRHIRVLPGVDGLNHRLFTDFQNLESVDFGTVQEARMCINNCALEYAYIPETMAYVGEYLFSWCENLRIVEIAGGAEGIGEGVFEGCMNLEQLWFEENARFEDVDIFTPRADSVSSEKVVLFVKRGSDAEEYALENDLNYGYH